MCQRCELLEEENRQLKAGLDQRFDRERAEFGLTASEYRIFRALKCAQTGGVHRDRLRLMAGTGESEGQYPYKSLHVLVHHLRKKLTGYKIINLFGWGYRIE